MQLRGLERWISVLRLFAFPFVLAAVWAAHYPHPWAMWSWITTWVFAGGSIAFFVLARSRFGNAHPLAQSLAAQLFDTGIVTAYVMVFSFERGTPVQQVLYIDLAAACVRFEVLGGLSLALVSAPIVAEFEKLRADRLGTVFTWKLVELQTGLELMMALIVGWLVRRLAAEGARAEARAEEEGRTVIELKRLSALRADFVSLVSHEVRTPMASVIGSARTLQQRWPDLKPDQRDAFLALIADETTRLAALVGEVLESSRIDAGTFSYTFDELDLGNLVTETVAQAGLGRDSVRLEAIVPADLPSVRGDRARLRQVLSNLIENAIKYSGEAGPVEVHARAANGHAEVEVVDHGAGIALEDQTLIFEKFGRVRGTSSKPGTGLGLYIARAIAEAHGGTLEVSSRSVGSTFTLTLPVCKPEDTDRRQPVPA